uniref:Uncharacterized protein n=1 Tax=Panagrolaimus sp. JU765 TaxID=591449 RepID=A0AC34QZJ7_9BILA
MHLMQSVWSNQPVNFGRVFEFWAPHIIDLAVKLELIKEPDNNSADDVSYCAAFAVFELLQYYTNKKKNNSPFDVLMEEKNMGSLAAMLCKKLAKNKPQPMIMILNTFTGRQYAIAVHEGFPVRGTMADAMRSLMEIYYIFSIKYRTAENFYYLMEQLAGLKSVKVTNARMRLCYALMKVAQEADQTPQFDSFIDIPDSSNCRNQESQSRNETNEESESRNNNNEESQSRNVTNEESQSRSDDHEESQSGRSHEDQ